MKRPTEDAQRGSAEPRLGRRAWCLFHFPLYPPPPGGAKPHWEPPLWGVTSLNPHTPIHVTNKEREVRRG